MLKELVFSSVCSGFEEVLVVTTHANKPLLSEYALERYDEDELVQNFRDETDREQLHVRIEAVKNDSDTADALREVRKKLQPTPSHHRSPVEKYVAQRSIGRVLNASTEVQTDLCGPLVFPSEI